MAARAASPAAPRRTPSRKPAPSGALRRFARIGLLVVIALLGIPLAHALAGEVVALLGAAILFGFLLGRWTAPR